MSRIGCRLGIARQVGLAVEGTGLGRFAPDDLQPVPPGERRFQALGRHRDPVRQGHGLQDTGNGEGFAVVDLQRRLALHRAAQNRGVGHARNAHIDGVGLRPAAFGWNIAPGQAVADQAIGAARLQVSLGDLGDFQRDGGEGGDLSVGEPAPGRSVYPGARLRDQALEGHGPVTRRHLQKHPPRLGAGLAQGVEIARYAGAAGGVEHAAEQRIAEGAVVAIQLFNVHLVPVGIQLLGEDEGQRGRAALAHFGRGEDDGDAVVCGDPKPDIGLQVAAFGRRGRPGHA